MVRAAKILEPFASAIDLNFGCPVKKVAMSNDGAGMMKTPELAYEIASAIKNVLSIPLSAKFRLGWTKNEENYIEFAKLLEKAGVDFITLHARTRSQMYADKADWEKIKLLVNEVKIPVFANGDIKSVEDAKTCLELTNAKGVSIGRGIMGDFSLPYRVEKYINSKEIIPSPSILEKIDMLKKHLKLEIQYMGEKNGIKFMRKFYNYYISSQRNASKYRSVLVRLENQEDVFGILNKIEKEIND